jgi:signal peptidase I
MVLAAFVGYIGSWYFGLLEGNFALVLFCASAVTGLFWLGERFYFLPQRVKAADDLTLAAARREADLQQMGITQTDAIDVAAARAAVLAQPWWLDWTAGLFPVIVSVFILRSFLFEPFKIPSGSMVPTLRIGDLILVNKFVYGLRLPVLNTRLTDGTPPQRGDVMVFRYPPKPSVDYIKRVIGVPGDEVAYLNKKLTLNGQAVDRTALPDFLDDDVMRYFKHFEEKLPGRQHQILQDDERPGFISGADDFPYRNQCRYSIEGVKCTVPAGHYFMMGDNRDNSLDSRYWGFVPEGNIVGKAFYVWMNFGNLRRIGSFD